MRTAVFELASEYGYKSLGQLARAMGVSVSLVWRTQRGQRVINGAFIVGARRAFPGKTLDELFPAEPVTLEVA